MTCLLLVGCGFSPAPSNVKISERPADGLTQASFDQGFLQQLVEETRQGAEKSLHEAYERNKIPQQERLSQARTIGRYEWIDGRQLAVIDLSYSANPIRVMRVVGIEADQVVTISCISPLGAPLDIHAKTGECAEALAKHFHFE
jgi:hypothetical protein